MIEIAAHRLTFVLPFLVGKDAHGVFVGGLQTDHVGVPIWLMERPHSRQYCIAQEKFVRCNMDPNAFFLATPGDPCSLAP